MSAHATAPARLDPSAWPTHDCDGPLRVEWIHDNANRTLTRVRCLTCQASWYGCKAKRLDQDNRPAWGNVGEQTWASCTTANPLP